MDELKKLIMEIEEIAVVEHDGNRDSGTIEVNGVLFRFAVVNEVLVITLDK
jgi:hypothetical protein